MPDDVLTEEDMAQMRHLLGKWVSQLREASRNSVLVNASELTYAFVNATCDHMGLPPDTNNIDPEIT